MNSAIISDCGTYRYRLDRHLGLFEGPVYAFFGVNGSTATAGEDDATVRKWTGFTRRLGGSRYIVGNLFAYRATDVRELARQADPVGPENDRYLAEIIAEADILVPCWGSRVKLPPLLRHRLATVWRMIESTGKPVKIWGRTASGDPLHPLMLSYETPLQSAISGE